MEISCVKPETAIRRFFRAFSEVTELAEWEEIFRESVDSYLLTHPDFAWGTFKDGEGEIGDDGKWHMWALEIQNVDESDGENNWYVSVTLSGVYTGRFD
jgi:hypothetical protein